jgi:hypothetical protein
VATDAYGLALGVGPSFTSRSAAKQGLQLGEHHLPRLAAQVGSSGWVRALAHHQPGPLPKSGAMAEESSPPRCDPRCMSSQPSQRRYQRWFGLLVVLVMLVAVPVVRAAHHYQQGVAGECALRFEADKTRLDETTGTTGTGGPQAGRVRSNKMGGGGSGISAKRRNPSRIHR